MADEGSSSGKPMRWGGKEEQTFSVWKKRFEAKLTGMDIDLCLEARTAENSGAWEKANKKGLAKLQEWLEDEYVERYSDVETD